MCLKAIEKTFGKEKYIAFIKQRYLTKKAMSKKYIQPNSIKSDIDNLHKYNYYPLVLLGLEQTVGQSKMFNFLDFLTNKTTSTFLNYETLKQTALSSGISVTECTDFENKYIKTDNCLKTIIERL